jgi:hypothetical protein
MTSTNPSQKHNPRIFLDPAHAITGLTARTVGDFWQWAYSDVLSNRNRSIFAEYLVGVALEAVDRPRVDWDSVDLTYLGCKVEVKSAADGRGPEDEETPAKIQFSIRKSTDMEPGAGGNGDAKARFADVYVFCHYLERDAEKNDVLDVGAWDFYVLSTKALNKKFGDAKSISLSSLRHLATAYKFEGLKARVDGVIAHKD